MSHVVIAYGPRRSGRSTLLKSLGCCDSFIPAPVFKDFTSRPDCVGMEVSDYSVYPEQMNVLQEVTTVEVHCTGDCDKLFSTLGPDVASKVTKVVKMSLL